MRVIVKTLAEFAEKWIGYEPPEDFWTILEDESRDALEMVGDADVDDAGNISTDTTYNGMS